MAWLTYWLLVSAFGQLDATAANKGDLSGIARGAAEARDWTDATGERHARAALIGLEGEKLRLRRTDGRQVTTTLSRISAADRQYVAIVRAQQADSTSRAQSQSLVQKVADQLPALASPSAWLLKVHPAVLYQRDVVPATLVYVRVSRSFLEDYVDRSVSTTEPVQDNILGTSIRGTSATDGKVCLVLRPSDNGAVGEIDFAGAVHSATIGHNGPAVFHYASDTKFHASKAIVVSGTGVDLSPAVVAAPTQLRTTSVATNLPRLMGRIASRIAARRDASAHQEAEKITSQHTAADIRRDFDQSVNRSVAQMETAIRSNVPDLKTDDDHGPAVVRFRSTVDYVEMAMIRRGATDEELSLRPPQVEGSPDVAVRVQRVALGHAMVDPQINQNIAPWLAKIAAAHAARTTSASFTPTDVVPNSIKWSIDTNWLTFDFTDPKRQSTELAVNEAGQ
jgi:hypothetical protein